MNIIYNNIIRKIVLSFGNLFSQIPLVRYDTNGNEQERFIVSLIYAPKEQYVHRLNDDPELDSKVQVVIPTMSYEMMGLAYDATRKQITNVKNYSQSPAGTLSQYNPVPYNFDFDLNLYSRTFDDAHQIVEHILSYFTPDYTIKINYIPSMGIVKEVPVILNSVDRDVDYEGDRETGPRRIIFTFHFTVKGFIFGKITDVTNKLITHTITNIYEDAGPDALYKFNLNPSGYGTYKDNEFVYQGTSLRDATASAKVVRYDSLNKILYLTNMFGDFISSAPLIGSSTNAKYYFTSSSPHANNAIATIDVTVSPAGANVNSNWTANTVITEYV